MRQLFILLMCSSLTGCSHQTPELPDDLKVKLHLALQNKESVRETVVIKAPKDIVRVRQMPEEEALRIWHETGVYRGLTDQEWIDLMINIEMIKQQEGE